MHRRPWLARVGAASLVLWAGCGGGSDIPRKAVSGTVSLDGQPLSSGSITFIPTGSGPAAGGTIADGAFAIGSADGPAPGAYRVEITSVQPTGRKVPNPDDPGQTIDETRNVVPARYNFDSELSAEIKDSGPNTFDFALIGKPAPRRGRR